MNSEEFKIYARETRKLERKFVAVHKLFLCYSLEVLERLYKDNEISIDERYTLLECFVEDFADDRHGNGRLSPASFLLYDRCDKESHKLISIKENIENRFHLDEKLEEIALAQAELEKWSKDKDDSPKSPLLPN